MTEIDVKYASFVGVLGEPAGEEDDAIEGGRYRHFQLMVLRAISGP